MAPWDETSRHSPGAAAELVALAGCRSAVGHACYSANARTVGEPRPRPYVYYDVPGEAAGDIEGSEQPDVLLVPTG